MPERKPQNFENHARFDTAFHLVAFPLLLLSLGLSIWMIVRDPGWPAVTLLVTQMVLTITFFLVRIYALRVQDRVIRLEERLRMDRLLPDALRPRIAELSEKQFVALRFASDAELPALVERALVEGLDQKQIKQAVRDWRADYFRV
jgi:hypothetical protein